MNDILECYKVLDLEPGVPADQVRKAYVQLAQVWDPQKYVANPILRDRAARRREEIDAAYKAISQFLPDLREAVDDEEPQEREIRDYQELATEGRLDSTKLLFGIILSLVFVALGVLAYVLFVKSRAQLPETTLAP